MFTLDAADQEGCDSKRWTVLVSPFSSLKNTCVTPTGAAAEAAPPLEELIRWAPERGSETPGLSNKTTEHAKQHIQNTNNPVMPPVSEHTTLKRQSKPCSSRRRPRNQPKRIRMPL